MLIEPQMDSMSAVSCDRLVTVDLQHDEQRITASLPDAPGAAPQPSARRPRPRGERVISLNRHLPGLKAPKSLVVVPHPGVRHKVAQNVNFKIQNNAKNPRTTEARTAIGCGMTQRV